MEEGLTMPQFWYHIRYLYGPLESQFDSEDSRFPGMIRVFNPIHVGEKITLFNKKGCFKKFRVDDINHEVGRGKASDGLDQSDTYLVVTG